MKKLLAITLVLGISAVANAAMVISIPTDGTVIDVLKDQTLVFTLAGDSIDPYDLLLEIPAPAGSLTAVEHGNIGGSGFLWGPAELGMDYWYAVAAGGPGAYPAVGETHFTFTYTANDDSSLVVIPLLNGDANPIGGEITIQNIPEPMTLGLLGLGGLFLRRRK